MLVKLAEWNVGEAIAAVTLPDERLAVLEDLMLGYLRGMLPPEIVQAGIEIKVSLWAKRPQGKQLRTQSQSRPNKRQHQQHHSEARAATRCHQAAGR